MEEVLRELAVTDEGKLCNILQNCTKLQFSLTCSLQADDPAWLGVAPKPVLRLGTALLIMHSSLSPKY